MMKGTLVLVAIAAVCSAMGQKTPNDVPSNHWAAPAVTKLYDLGILQGYPDGMFRGSRPVSRYEMAEAINKMFSMGKDITNGLQSQIDQWKEVSHVGADNHAMQDRLAAIGIALDKVSVKQSDIEEVSSSFASIQKQLEAIRGNLDSMKLPELPKKSG